MGERKYSSVQEAWLFECRGVRNFIKKGGEYRITGTGRPWLEGKVGKAVDACSPGLPPQDTARVKLEGEEFSEWIHPDCLEPVSERETDAA